MAKQKLVNPAAALGEAARFSDLRQRLLFLVGALIVYRIGTFIPVPGIDPVAQGRQGFGPTVARLGGLPGFGRLGRFGLAQFASPPS